MLSCPAYFLPFLFFWLLYISDNFHSLQYFPPVFQNSESTGGSFLRGGFSEGLSPHQFNHWAFCLVILLNIS